VYVVEPRRYFQHAPPRPSPVMPTPDPADRFRWPELVAAELDRIEREAGR
jgi:hypothetical protein